MASKTFWKAIHSDRIIDSTAITNEEKPYLGITRKNLEKVVFYEEGKEETPIIEFNTNNIFFRLRPLIQNNQPYGRRWVIEADNKVCIIDFENKAHIFNSYEEADTYPINKSKIDSL
jgi:hypothetical protein